MEIGMLWFDNDPKTDLNTKLSKALLYYRQKYGKPATICFIHPSMMEGFSPKPAAVEIRQNAFIRPNHFWLGMQS